MIRKIYIASLSIVLLFAFSCHKAKKNMEDYYPKLNTTGATVTDDGDVVVEAEIVSAGTKRLEYWGFCMDTLPVPGMLSNQVIVSEINGSTFNTKYDNVTALYSYYRFNPNKTYYFRSWATNGNGYGYGNVISLSNIKGIPVIPSCTLAASYLNLGTLQPSSAYSAVGGPTLNVNNTYDMQAQSWSSGTLNFNFGSKPRNKVFKTITGSPGVNEVNVSFVSGFTSGTLNNGTNVYVNEVSTGVYDITICQAPWVSGGATFFLNTRFTSPT
jgi:hypothetical protein